MANFRFKIDYKTRSYNTKVRVEIEISLRKICYVAGFAWGSSDGLVGPDGPAGSSRAWP